jgi:Flp pilus assembly protein TadD
MNAAVDANPREPELWLFRGRYRIDAGDCRGAATDFDRAVALAPADAAAYAAQGIARLCLNDRTEARRAFEQSLRLDPAQPKVRQYLDNLR